MFLSFFEGCSREGLASEVRTIGGEVKDARSHVELLFCLLCLVVNSSTPEGGFEKPKGPPHQPL